MAFGLETGPDTVVNIKVIGVGGGGVLVAEREKTTLSPGERGGVNGNPPRL